jgi:hypothetical protein
MSSVVVTPLQPPFAQSVMHFQFKGVRKYLTVSIADGERIKALLGNKPINRDVIIGPVDNNDIDVMISVLQ